MHASLLFFLIQLGLRQNLVIIRFDLQLFIVCACNDSFQICDVPLVRGFLTELDRYIAGHLEPVLAPSLLQKQTQRLPSQILNALVLNLSGVEILDWLLDAKILRSISELNLLVDF